MMNFAVGLGLFLEVVMLCLCAHSLLI